MSHDISAVRFGQELQDKEGAEFRRLNFTDVWLKVPYIYRGTAAEKLDRSTLQDKH
jgi:hypothetical protein